MTGHAASAACNKRANIFAVLGCPRRLEIVEMLARASCELLELASRLRISRPAVSRHLKLLRKVGLVSREVTGHGVLFRLTPTSIAANIRVYAAELDRCQPGDDVEEEALRTVHRNVRCEHSQFGYRELPVRNLVALRSGDTTSGQSRLQANQEAWKTRDEILAICDLEIANRAKVAI